MQCMHGGEFAQAGGQPFAGPGQPFAGPSIVMDFIVDGDGGDGDGNGGDGGEVCLR